MEDASAVDRVKAALLERDEALANSDLQKARAALAEAQTAAAEKETTLTTMQTQLQQDHTTLKGARSRPSRRPRRRRGRGLTWRRRPLRLV
jgi:multidrug resistance efflux pump